MAEGNWGNVDLIAGVRLLAIDNATNFSLAVDITRPDGSIALGRSGNLSASKSVWNGIGGVRGRVYLGDGDWFGGGKFFVPYYFDIGGGGSDPTWQIFGGVGYEAGRVGVSVGYRYLSFHQGSNVAIQKCRWAVPSSPRTSSFRLRRSAVHISPIRMAPARIFLSLRVHTCPQWMTHPG